MLSMTKLLNQSIFFFATCVVLLVANACEAQQSKNKVYLIGNSLTWDTLPGLLDGNVMWHVDCGKNLQYIHDHPAKPCVRTSTRWDVALANNQFDVLCVQPHFGTTIEQDAEIISSWLKTQKNARLVVHTGWNRHKDLTRVYRAEASKESDAMVHAPNYFLRLESEIRQRHPQVEITSTHAIDVLDSIQSDIESEAAPIEKLSDLYRDDIHVTTQAGRYLMHNLMRVAVGQKVSNQGFKVARPLQTYLRNKVDFAASIRAKRLVSTR